jgi:hypothetical protein
MQEPGKTISKLWLNRIKGKPLLFYGIFVVVYLCMIVLYRWNSSHNFRYILEWFWSILVVASCWLPGFASISDLLSSSQIEALAPPLRKGFILRLVLAYMFMFCLILALIHLGTELLKFNTNGPSDMNLTWSQSALFFLAGFFSAYALSGFGLLVGIIWRNRNGVMAGIAVPVIIYKFLGLSTQIIIKHHMSGLFFPNSVMQ